MLSKLKNRFQSLYYKGRDKELVRGIGWSVAGTLISRFMVLCATVLIARALGAAEYGQLGIIQSTIGTFSTLATFGLGITITKHVAEYRSDNKARVGRIISLSILISLIISSSTACLFFLLSTRISVDVINAPHLIDLIRIGAVLLINDSLISVLSGTLAGFGAFKSIAKISAITGVISLFTLVLGTYQFGLLGTVIAMIINTTIQLVLLVTVTRQILRRWNISLDFTHCLQEIHVLHKFALPALISGLMITPAHWITRSMLVNQPDGFSSMGLYSAALVFQSIILLSGRTLTRPLLAAVSNAGKNISTNLSRFNILSTWALGVFFCVPLLSFPEIATLVFGREFNNGEFKLTFIFVIFAAAIMMFKEGLSRVIIANNLMWWSVLSNASWALTLVLSTYLLLGYGSTGLAAALVISYTLNVIALFPLFWRLGIIEKNTLVSKEAIFIWIILILLLVSNIFGAPLWLRSLLFLPYSVALAFLFWKIIISDG